MSHPLDLSGRLYLVSGASSGIGAETSRLLSELGARVWLLGRDERRLTEVERSLVGEGHRVWPLDLVQGVDLDKWLRAAAKQFGELHGLVHCAGLHALQPLRSLDQETQEKLFRVNVFAAAALAKAFRQRGVRHENASMVFVASVAALVGQPAVSTYAATKGAIVAMTRSLALELARESIRVNCVAPGMVQTPMEEGIRKVLGVEQMDAMQALHPLGFGQPRDVAYAIAFLLADTARWITGSTLVVDGGYTAH